MHAVKVAFVLDVARFPLRHFAVKTAAKRIMQEAELSETGIDRTADAFSAESLKARVSP